MIAGVGIEVSDFSGDAAVAGFGDFGLAVDFYVNIDVLGTRIDDNVARLKGAIITIFCFGNAAIR